MSSNKYFVIYAYFDIVLLL